MEDSEPDSNGVPRHTASLRSVRDLAAAIDSILRTASALAESGRRIDLSGLEGPIGILCAKALDLPPEKGRQIRILLVLMLQEVDGMAATIRMFRDSAAGRR